MFDVLVRYLLWKSGEGHMEWDDFVPGLETRTDLSDGASRERAAPRTITGSICVSVSPDRPT